MLVKILIFIFAFLLLHQFFVASQLIEGLSKKQKQNVDKKLANMDDRCKKIMNNAIGDFRNKEKKLNDQIKKLKDELEKEKENKDIITTDENENENENETI
jgi:uncharacterized protein YlxW (UPF0749 family)